MIKFWDGHANLVDTKVGGEIVVLVGVPLHPGLQVAYLPQQLADLLPLARRLVHLVGELAVQILDLVVGLGEMLDSILHKLLLLLLTLVRLLGKGERFSMQFLVVILKVVDLPLEHLNVDVAKLQRRRLLQVICVDMQ